MACVRAQVHGSELSYFVNGTEALLTARGSTTLHGSVADVDRQSTAAVRVAQTADGTVHLFRLYIAKLEHTYHTY